MIQRLWVVAAVLLSVASAQAETAPAPVRISEAPLGKFGFSAGYGGPIRSLKIRRLVVQESSRAAPRKRPACARATRSWRSMG